MSHIPATPLHPVRNERGMALLVALMSTLLLLALGMGLVMTTMTETLITTNYRDSGEAMYAADAGVERVMQDLLTVSDWNRILQGQVRSTFIDGAPNGTRRLPDGSTLDLVAATNLLNCNKTTACTAAEMDAFTPDRPFSANNPRWQLFAHAPLATIIETGTVLSPMYVAVWIGDDQAENDNNPTVDGPATNGGGVLLMRAQAYGGNGVSSVIEVTVGRTDTAELERGYTGQRGQDEQNRRARKKRLSEENLGKLTRSEMNATTGSTFGVR